MFDAASLPIAAREKLAATIRLEDGPGPRRVALIRDLGLVPLASDGDVSKPAAKGTRPDKPSGHPEWDAFAASVRASLAVSDAPLSFFLPNLKLFSENHVQHGDRNNDKTFIQVRHAAKVHALMAIMSAPTLALHRFSRVVRIEVWQVCDRHRVDPGNLYAKSLVDALLTSSGGLGILQDDSRKFVSFVGTGYRAGEDESGVGVWVEMRVEGAT